MMSNNVDAYLKTSLVKYKSPDVAKRDISNVLQQYKDLRPSLDNFTFNDGTQKQLLNLEGTIPVGYKGNVYNIPVCIWILDTHPYNPPMAYVRPTNTMQIKPNRYVDANGKVDMAYLREWKYGQSDLLAAIQILTLTFGEECPVFSKMAPRQPPPYPTPGGGPQPPYPTGPGIIPMPGMGQPGGPNPPYPSYQGGGGSYPPQGGGGYPSYPAQGYPSTSQSSYGGYPNPTYGQPSYVGAQQPPPQYPQQYPYGNNPPYPASTSYPGTAATTNSSPVNRPSTGTVTEAHIKASLLSAVEDKMKRRLRETFAQAQAEMDVLKKTQTDLMNGKEKLEKMIRDLERERDDVEQNIHLLTEKDNEVKDALKKLENNDQLDIDEAVVTTTPLYRQLLNTFAEEQAIEDAVYYLGEAIRKNVIELEVFLKQVRELSRKQFMLRALIQKCREKAGLPPLA